MGLRAGLCTATRGRILCLCLKSNPCHPVQSVVRHCTDRAPSDLVDPEVFHHIQKYPVLCLMVRPISQQYETISKVIVFYILICRCLHI
jgi:hypothetical protein